MLKYPHVLLAVFLVFFTALPAAADDTRYERTYDLGEVEIVSERPSVAEASGTVSVITQEDIRRSAAQNLTEVLRQVPGLSVRRAPQGMRIDIRGYRTRQIMLLVDGVPVATAADGTFDPNAIPTANIARIKVIRGNSSLLYGPGGIAGIINIITKKGSEGVLARGSLQTALTHEATRGSVEVGGGTETFNVYASVQALSDTGFPMSGDFPSGDSVTQGSGKRRYSANNDKNAYLNLGYSPAETTDLGFVAIARQNKVHLPNEVLSVPSNSTSGGGSGEGNPNRQIMRDTDTDITLQLAARHNFSNPFTLRGWAFYTKQEVDEIQETLVSNPVGSPYRPLTTLDQSSTTSRFGGTTIASWADQGFGNLSVAVNFERSFYKDDGFNYRYNNSLVLQPLRPQDLISSSEKISRYTGTVEYSLAPEDKVLSGFLAPLGLIFGVSGHNAQWRDPGNDRDNDENGWSSLFGLTYAVDDIMTLRGNVGRVIRFPSVDQLYDSQRGNPGLKPETAVQGEAGFDLYLPWDATFGFTWFQSNIKDFIQRGGPLDRQENIARYQMNGVELLLSQQLTSALAWDATYTFTDAYNKSEGSRFQQTPRHKFTAGVNCDVGYGFSARVQAQGAADTIMNDGAALDDYVRIDANLIYAVTDNVDINLRVDNIFDSYYLTNRGQPEPGRQAFLGLTVTF